MQVQISHSSRERLGARLVVASTSGGKDSTALTLMLMEAACRRSAAAPGYRRVVTYTSIPHKEHRHVHA